MVFNEGKLDLLVGNYRDLTALETVEPKAHMQQFDFCILKCVHRRPKIECTVKNCGKKSLILEFRNSANCDPAQKYENKPIISFGWLMKKLTSFVCARCTPWLNDLRWIGLHSAGNAAPSHTNTEALHKHWRPTGRWSVCNRFWARQPTTCCVELSFALSTFLWTMKPDSFLALSSSCTHGQRRFLARADFLGDLFWAHFLGRRFWAVIVSQPHST